MRDFPQANSRTPDFQGWLAGWLVGGSGRHLGCAESCLGEAGIFRLLAPFVMGLFRAMQIPDP